MSGEIISSGPWEYAMFEFSLKLFYGEQVIISVIKIRINFCVCFPSLRIKKAFNMFYFCETWVGYIACW